MKNLKHKRSKSKLQISPSKSTLVAILPNLVSSNSILLVVQGTIPASSLTFFFFFLTLHPVLNRPVDLTLKPNLSSPLCLWSKPLQSYQVCSHTNFCRQHLNESLAFGSLPNAFKSFLARAGRVILFKVLHVIAILHPKFSNRVSSQQRKKQKMKSFTIMNKALQKLVIFSYYSPYFPLHSRNRSLCYFSNTVAKLPRRSCAFNVCWYLNVCRGHPLASCRSLCKRHLLSL